jgi:hypothetical protein
MVRARESKVIENDQLVHDTEATVIKTIKIARSQLTGLKLQTKELKFKDGPHATAKHMEHDFEFPKKDKLCYDNHIVGFRQKKNAFGINIIMSNGD